MNAPLREMFEYNRWATLRLLEDCQALDDSVLDSRPPGATGTLRELLLHIVGGQRTFALRTRGRQHEGEFTRASSWPGWEALLEEAASSANDLVEIAGDFDVDDEVTLPYGGKGYRFPRRFFMLHAMEHGGEHRAEIRAGLRALGIETRDLDCWEFASEQGYGAEA